MYVVFRPVWRYKRLEVSVLKKVDEIITVVDEAKTHYVEDCKIPPEKITVVMNSVDLKEFRNFKKTLNAILQTFSLFLPKIYSNFSLFLQLFFL